MSSPLVQLLSGLNIDTVVSVLNKTLFSTSFCLAQCATVLALDRRLSNPVFRLAAAWAVLVIIIPYLFHACGVLRHADRVYSSGSSWYMAPQLIEWKEQVVLITGGGTGVGALLAETLAAKDVKVVVLTIDEPRYSQPSDKIHTYICDVANYDQVHVIAEKVREEVGEPTILINNAGVVKGKLLLDLTKEDVENTFGANTLAHFWTLKAFLPAMLRKNSGHIVTVSSVLGLVGAAQMTDYCASKAALVSLHSTLRFELDNRYKTPRVKTTILLPAFILTSLFAKIRFPSNPLIDFLCPPLKPEVIVDAIIDALEEQESRTIRLPFYTNFGRFLGTGPGLIPKWLGDIIQKISGADFAMREYGPKPNAAQRLHADISGKVIQDKKAE